MATTRDDERDALRAMALGRILRICARPVKPGDIEEYERCRAIIMDAEDPVLGYVANYARDYGQGAKGDW